MEFGTIKRSAIVLVAAVVSISMSACAVYSSEPGYGYGNGGYYSVPHYGGGDWRGGYRHDGWHDGDDHDGGRR